jgi:hypothetical protein
MPRLLVLLVSIGLFACTSVECPSHSALATQAPIVLPSQVVVLNATNEDTVVHFSFGADSVVLPSSWPFCTASSKLNCSFPLKARTGRALPSSGYLNVTAAFGAAVGCGVTKAELNVNNPKWYDVVDISLVDGYSNDIFIEFTDKSGTKKLGPVLSKSGNEKAFGVYPLGCDICVARQNPPCGMTPGADGCKGGTQFSPSVPCQLQGASMGGGAYVSVALVKPEPAAK